MQQRLHSILQQKAMMGAGEGYYGGSGKRWTKAMYAKIYGLRKGKNLDDHWAVFKIERSIREGRKKSSTRKRTTKKRTTRKRRTAR